MEHLKYAGFSVPLQQERTSYSSSGRAYRKINLETEGNYIINDNFTNTTRKGVICYFDLRIGFYP